MSVEVNLAGALDELAVAVDEALEAELADGSPPYLHDAARHLVRAGGKRVRPAVMLLVADAVEPDGDRQDRLPAALAVELIHTLSLIHDDVIDADELRRGVDSVHVEWDQSTAIVAGDLLYARAFELVGRTNAPVETRLECTRVLARACRRLCEGQARDMALASPEELDESTYLRAIEGKTGALFEAAAELGARLGGADEAVASAAAAYGRSLGTAFQLHDDVLDVAGSTAAMGKPSGSDLNGEKPTLVTIHAADAGVDVGALDAGGIEARRRELEAAGSLDYVREQADRHVSRALHELEHLPRSSARETLGALARYAVERDR